MLMNLPRYARASPTFSGRFALPVVARCGPFLAVDALAGHGSFRPPLRNLRARAQAGVSPIILGDRSRPRWPSLRTPRPSVQRERYAMGTLEPIALSPRDAAQFLSISKRTMSRLISSRRIAARKDGKRTLVDVASLKAYLRACRSKPIPCRLYSSIRSRAGVTGRVERATDGRREGRGPISKRIGVAQA